MEVQPDPLHNVEPTVKSAKRKNTKSDVSKFLHSQEEKSFIFVSHYDTAIEIEVRHKDLTASFPL
jgi:hypothetical protein